MHVEEVRERVNRIKTGENECKLSDLDIHENDNLKTKKYKIPRSRIHCPKNGISISRNYGYT